MCQIRPGFTPPPCSLKPGLHERSIPCPAASIVPCTALQRSNHLFMECNQQPNVIIKAVKRRFKGTKWLYGKTFSVEPIAQNMSPVKSRERSPLRLSACFLFKIWHLSSEDLSCRLPGITSPTYKPCSLEIIRLLTLGFLIISAWLVDELGGQQCWGEAMTSRTHFPPTTVQGASWNIFSFCWKRKPRAIVH